MRISKVILDNQDTPVTWEYLRFKGIPEMDSDSLEGIMFNQGLVFKTGIIIDSEYIETWRIHIINNI